MRHRPQHARSLRRSFRPGGGLSVVTVLAGLAALAGCGSDEPRTQVLVLGDSITNLTSEELFERPDDDRQLTVHARNGATSDEMLAVARDDGPSDYDQVIVNLGTNDLMAQTPTEQTEDVIEEIIEFADDARCIHLTTINEHIVNDDIPDISERTKELNNRYRDLVDRHSHVHLIDWNAELESHRDRGEPGGELLADMVHPTDRGQAALRRLYVEALDDCG